MTVLRIDAAWTSTQPTGVALVIRKNDSWETVCVAPSYASFVSYACGEKPDWSRAKYSGAKPVMCDLLKAGESMAGKRVDLVAIDMPISTERITGRRVADDKISKRFGKYGCAAHTPSERRPGPLGEEMTSALTELGYPVATANCIGGTLNRTIEVYPHPALMSLLGLEYRFAYKVSKSRRFWPCASVAERIESLLTQFSRIYAALASELGDPGFSLPPADAVATLASLKRYEDALDALISAWVGVKYLHGRATPHGDATAAVWVP